MKGNKHLQFMADCVVGVVRGRGNERKLAILKHTDSPIDFDAMDPLTFTFQGASAIPFEPAQQARELLGWVEAGATSLVDLEFFMKMSRPTLLKAVEYLVQYGLLVYEEGPGGRGIHTHLKIRKY